MNQGAFTVLLVEDQLRFQKVYAAAIAGSLGVDVALASTGDQALRLLQAEPPPGLVILDLEIPGLSGERLLAQMRSDHRLAQIPVIILTGSGGEERQMQLLEQGADDFIEKGGSPAVLIARLRAQMRHKLAVERLERLALDRDLFAAAVLQDIGASRGTITSLCQQAMSALNQAGPDSKAQVLALCDKLSSHAGQLGAYAHDVIQSVRDSQHTPELAQQDLGAVLAWTSEVAQGAFTWQVAAPLQPVLADQSYLRLALLNIVQRALRSAAGKELAIAVEQSESRDDREHSDRRFVTTRFRDNAAPLAASEVAHLFKPHLRYLPDEAEGDEEQGFSIGLSVVAKVMVRMGGRVWAERAEPGTSIYLELLAP